MGVEWTRKQEECVYTSSVAEAFAMMFSRVKWLLLVRQGDFECDAMSFFFPFNDCVMDILILTGQLEFSYSLIVLFLINFICLT